MESSKRFYVKVIENPVFKCMVLCDEPEETGGDCFLGRKRIILSSSICLKKLLIGGG